VDLSCGRRAVRASVGSAVVPARGAAEAVGAADAAMYEVKRARRAAVARR
jgi:GGDEF domain-containing protein